MGNSSCTYHMCMASPQCGSTCVCQGFFIWETLPTLITFVRPCQSVDFLMFIKALFLWETLPTSITSVCLLCSVNYHVFNKVSFYCENLLALITCIWLPSTMKYYVKVKILLAWETLSAVRASETFIVVYQWGAPGYLFSLTWCFSPASMSSLISLFSSIRSKIKVKSFKSLIFSKSLKHY